MFVFGGFIFNFGQGFFLADDEKSFLSHDKKLTRRSYVPRRFVYICKHTPGNRLQRTTISGE